MASLRHKEFPTLGQRTAKTPGEPESARGLGRGMSIIAWIVLLGLMTTFFQGKLDDRRNPNRTVSSSLGEDGRAEVVLERNRMGHYVANGTINGVRVTFLLDTGATGVAISPELAQRAGAPRGKAIMTRTANGNAQGFLTQLKSVQLGAIEQNNVPAQIAPGLATAEVLLGMSFLKHLEMVQRGDTLTLRQ